MPKGHAILERLNLSIISASNLLEENTDVASGIIANCILLDMAGRLQLDPSWFFCQCTLGLPCKGWVQKRYWNRAAEVIAIGNSAGDYCMFDGASAAFSFDRHGCTDCGTAVTLVSTFAEIGSIMRSQAAR